MTVEQEPKRKIFEKLNNFGCYTFEGKVENVIAQLQEMINNYGPDITLDYGQHHSYDDSYSFNLLRQREETDAEYATRMEQDARYRAGQLVVLKQQAEQLGFKLSKKDE